MSEKFREALRNTVSRCIQGGMGIGISSWRLAQAVAKAGGIGTVSGAAIHIVTARRLQMGDPGGNLKRGFDAFPFKDVARRVYNKYFIPGGKQVDESFHDPEKFSLQPSRSLIELVIISNFAEVFLAKEGHAGMVGINYLEKIQMPHIFSLFGALLAGVDFVTVGAGIPNQFPSVMEGLAARAEVEYRLDVTGAAPGEFVMRFDPADFFEEHTVPKISVPGFLPIISSTVLAKRLAKELPGKIDAFVIEGPTAGGHNAPPRNKNIFNERGEPVYGSKDQVDLAAIRNLGIPDVLAGGYAHPEKAERALQEGASAVQVGTIFQYSEDSGLAANLRQIAKNMAFRGQLDVLTSAVSPTGYPFKVARIPGTSSDQVVYDRRPRICDLGFLRELYKIRDGLIGYRCSAEPVGAYLKKGGRAEDCRGKACLCNCLPANIGLAQRRPDGYIEPPLITSGDDTSFIRPPLVNEPNGSYSAEDALRYVFGKKG